MGLTTGATDIKPCQLLQKGAIEYFGSLASESNKPFTGTTDALLSPVNKKGLSLTQTINDGGLKPVTGGVRKVQLKYLKPTCDGDCPVTPATECNIPAGSANDLGFADFTVDDFCGFNFQLTDAEFYKMCENRDSFILEQLNTRVNQAKRNIEKKVITKINALMGTYADGTSSITAPKDIPFLNPDKTPNIGAFLAIQEAYMNKGYGDAPIWVSQSLNILKLMKPFLGTANSGIDLGGVDVSRHFYSNLLDSTINAPLSTDQNVLTWIPGTFQFVEYFENDRKTKYEPTTVTINGKTITTAKEQLSTMMLGGWKWDVFFKYDCGVHTWFFQKYFDVFQLPADAVCDNTYPALKFLNTCESPIVCGSIECKDI